MGQHGHSGAREVIVIAQRGRERERRSSGFLPIAPLGGGAAKMATQRRSIERRLVVLRWEDGSEREEKRLERGGYGG
jgi:hypothetical protein